jgi:hypothetical protein
MLLYSFGGLLKIEVQRRLAPNRKQNNPVVLSVKSVQAK